MRIVIAGGHGKIALRLLRQLTESGHTGVGLVRNPEQLPDLAATGQSGVVCDLESASVAQVADLLKGADVAVFAAGAGPGSGADRKDGVDRGASVLFADAAQQAGVGRFIQISAAGAGAPPQEGTDEVWAAYLQAKTAAEDDLRTRDLDWTILRPGALTDDPGTGLVALHDPPAGQGEITRDDVASVIIALFEAGLRRTLELRQGSVPIAQAVADL
ncbi:MAG: NAD(P)-binding oxidoreductase [Streptosporangiaceae bacterium]